MNIFEILKNILISEPLEKTKEQTPFLNKQKPTHPPLDEEEEFFL